MAKMEPELKAKWVTALRSGNFQQTKHSLKVKREDGSFSYCCLGVFGEVCGLEWLDKGGNMERLYPMIDGQNISAHSLGSYYSEGFAEQYGLGNHMNENSWQHHLAEMNDEGIKFDQIADHIEKSDI